MFQHFILTRFNLTRLNGMPEVDKNNQPVLTEEWLDERFYLFEKYCLPSLINQSCKKFIWILMFSSNTPKKYLPRIHNYELQFPFIKPFFFDSGDHETVKKEFNSLFPQFIGPKDEYVITTRIDNDDAFHKDMVKEIHKLFDKQENIFLSFTYGLQYDIKRKILARMHYGDNHFISRFEKISKNVETVITHKHTSIQEVAEVTYIQNKQNPMWLEIIHEGNAINYLQTSSLPLFYGKIRKSFMLQEKLSPLNTIFAYYKYLRLKFFLLGASFLKILGIYDLIKGNVRSR